MKHLFTRLIALMAALLLPATASAYDFMTGGLAYNINSDGTSVSVTYTELSYSNYSGLTEANIPESVSYNGKTYSVTSIGREAFYGCTGLTSVTISNSVTSIGSKAFYGCSGLKSVIIPNSVTSIGNYAFYYCSGLTSVTIPNSVTTIGYSAFSGCSGLTKVNITDLAAWCNIDFGVDGNPLFYAHHLFLNNSEITNLVIPNSVTSIGNYAFYGCGGLTSITIPNSVTSIGSSAFYRCSGLTELTWNAVNCPSMGEMPKENLERVTIGDMVESLPDGFVYKSKISSVIIPNSVTSIGEYAFGECSCLTSVTIPNSVTEIGEWAFSYCSGLTSVTIPNSVTSISGYAFCGCSGLTSVTIPNSVTSIGGSAFSDCYSLTSITIPNSVTSIGGGAFSNCSSLTSVTIPNSVTSIGNYAFSFCSSLTSVTIPNSVTSIGSSAFYYCRGLTSVTIPNSVTSIGYEVFYGCSGLKELSLTGKGEWNLDVSDLNFSQIKTLNVGSEISSLGGKRFDPDVVKSYAEVPPICTDRTFANYNAQLHMPASATAAYFTAPYWQNFNNIVNDITQKVRLDKSSIDVKISDEQQLHATVTPASMAGEVVWCSSNPAVARVDENGKVTMLAKGECDIFASLSSIPAVYASCHVGVHPFINLDITKASIAPNQILTLTPSFAPEETDIVVTSSNPGVAAARVVTQDSVKKVLVVGVSLGKATITVASTNADYIPATCVVTVREGGDGDVDGNGIVDVDDVNAVINLILFYEQYKDRYTGNPDIDGNGLIDVDDVNEIINIILES